MTNTTLLTPEQVADQLQMSVDTVKRYLRNGDLRGVKLGGKIWRVHPDDFQAFVEERRSERPRG